MYSTLWPEAVILRNFSLHRKWWTFKGQLRAIPAYVWCGGCDDKRMLTPVTHVVFSPPVFQVPIWPHLRIEEQTDNTALVVPPSRSPKYRADWMLTRGRKTSSFLWLRSRHSEAVWILSGCRWLRSDASWVGLPWHYKCPMIVYVKLTWKETTSKALSEFSALIIYGTYAPKAFSALTKHIRASYCWTWLMGWSLALKLNRIPLL